MSTLSRSFYLQDTVKVARKLIGKTLVRKGNRIPLEAMIVETEAYCQDDPASHSYRGQTARSAPMFEKGGISYVYFIYGMYDCFNVVTEKAGYGGAVLIRAVHPISGIENMWQNRFGLIPFNETKIKNLTNGPGKLCRALKITTKNDNKKDLTQGDLTIRKGKNISSNMISNDLRIGISKATDKYWRFYLKDDPFVSRIK